MTKNKAERRPSGSRPNPTICLEFAWERMGIALKRPETAEMTAQGNTGCAGCYETMIPAAEKTALQMGWLNRWAG